MSDATRTALAASVEGRLVLTLRDEDREAVASALADLLLARALADESREAAPHEEEGNARGNGPWGAVQHTSHTRTPSLTRLARNKERQSMDDTTLHAIEALGDVWRRTMTYAEMRDALLAASAPS